MGVKPYSPLSPQVKWSGLQETCTPLPDWTDMSSCTLYKTKYLLPSRQDFLIKVRLYLKVDWKFREDQIYPVLVITPDFGSHHSCRG